MRMRFRRDDQRVGREEAEMLKADAQNRVRQRFGDTFGMVGDLMTSRQAQVASSTSTGVVSLDASLGGKLPSGIIEIFGEASAGKSTLLFETIATAQASGMMVALCPSEYLDVPYMRKLGVDLNSLILITGNCGEDVLDGGLHFLRTHRVPAMLALDSATGLRPRDDRPGEWQVMLSRYLEEMLECLSAGSCVVMLNQVRMKRSIEANRFFVDGALTSTAKKIVGLLSTRLELSRGAEREGNKSMLVDIVMNTAARPARTLELPLSPDGGVNTILDLLQFGVATGVVEQSGAWYSVGQYKLGNGLSTAVKYLGENEEAARYLLDQVMVGA